MGIIAAFSRDARAVAGTLNAASAFLLHKAARALHVAALSSALNAVAVAADELASAGPSPLPISPLAAANAINTTNTSTTSLIPPRLIVLNIVAMALTNSGGTTATITPSTRLATTLAALPPAVRAPAPDTTAMTIGATATTTTTTTVEVAAAAAALVLGAALRRAAMDYPVLLQLTINGGACGDARVRALLRDVRVRVNDEVNAVIQALSKVTASSSQQQQPSPSLAPSAAAESRAHALTMSRAVESAAALIDAVHASAAFADAEIRGEGGEGGNRDAASVWSPVVAVALAAAGAGPTSGIVGEGRFDTLGNALLGAWVILWETHCSAAAATAASSLTASSSILSPASSAPLLLAPALYAAVPGVVSGAGSDALSYAIAATNAGAAARTLILCGLAPRAARGGLTGVSATAATRLKMAAHICPAAAARPIVALLKGAHLPPLGTSATACLEAARLSAASARPLSVRDKYALLPRILGAGDSPHLGGGGDLNTAATATYSLPSRLAISARGWMKDTGWLDFCRTAATLLVSGVAHAPHTYSRVRYVAQSSPSTFSILSPPPPSSTKSTTTTTSSSLSSAVSATKTTSSIPLPFVSPSTPVAAARLVNAHIEGLIKTRAAAANAGVTSVSSTSSPRGAFRSTLLSQNGDSIISEGGIGDDIDILSTPKRTTATTTTTANNNNGAISVLISQAVAATPFSPDFRPLRASIALTELMRQRATLRGVDPQDQNIDADDEDALLLVVQEPRTPKSPEGGVEMSGDDDTVTDQVFFIDASSTTTNIEGIEIAGRIHQASGGTQLLIAAQQTSSSGGFNDDFGTAATLRTIAAAARAHAHATGGIAVTTSALDINTTATAPMLLIAKRSDNNEDVQEQEHNNHTSSISMGANNMTLDPNTTANSTATNIVKGVNIENSTSNIVNIEKSASTTIIPNVIPLTPGERRPISSSSSLISTATTTTIPPPATPEAILSSMRARTSAQASGVALPIRFAPSFITPPTLPTLPLPPTHAEMIAGVTNNHHQQHQSHRFQEQSGGVANFLNTSIDAARMRGAAAMASAREKRMSAILIASGGATTATCPHPAAPLPLPFFTSPPSLGYNTSLASSAAPWWSEALIPERSAPPPEAPALSRARAQAELLELQTTALRSTATRTNSIVGERSSENVAFLNNQRPMIIQTPGFELAESAASLSRGNSLAVSRGGGGGGGGGSYQLEALMAATARGGGTVALLNR